MFRADEIRIAAPGVRSLVWEGDVLVDWVAGGRCFALRDGSVLRAWPQFATGTQTSSILMAEPSMPPIALDAANQRLAVADVDGITVLQFVPDTAVLR